MIRLSLTTAEALTLISIISGFVRMDYHEPVIRKDALELLERLHALIKAASAGTGQS
jgi:hypothetical protein